ncbi:ClpX C4-type zinc finger protein [Myxococcus stipitatus]|nr:ClpX C4-type zinc finger protein [Myxococcus stipitatus]
MDAPPVRSTWRPDPRDEEPAPRRRREPRIIERGPTRADVAVEAWCSFCCRPQAEVGALVAGPAAAFICKACLTESASLLGDVKPVPRPTHPGSAVTSAADLDFVGQPEVMASIERSLLAGARCLLVVGPEGCGKSTLFSQWQRRGWGVRASVASLSETASTTPLLVEDADRLSPEDHAALCAFLGRDVRPAVVLSARGQAREHGGVRLRGDAGPCVLPTTEALSHAVQGRIPTGVLERVQVLVSLPAPSVADSMEIARARLASRDPAVILSEDALAAIAKEASRSPRAGHELRALLDRIPAGTWGLEPEAKKPAAPRKGRRKGTS